MIQYNAPTGRDVINPSEDFLKNIIFEKSADYWKQGSGESGLSVEGSDQSLMFFYDEPYGFFVMELPDYRVPKDENKTIETVLHSVGGEFMKIPTCSFINRDEMFSVILSFVGNGTVPPSKKIKWDFLYNIKFEHDF